MTIKLRPQYQEPAAQMLLAHIEAHDAQKDGRSIDKNMLLELPTGSGKTTVVAEVLRRSRRQRLLDATKQVTWIAPRRTLLGQGIATIRNQFNMSNATATRLFRAHVNQPTIAEPAAAWIDL